MKSEEFEKITKNIQKKLGKESSALISDDLATMMLNNKAMNEEIQKHQDEIKELKQNKEELLLTNSKLFQQVGFEETKPSKKEDIKKPFNIKDCLDENGDFII